MMRPNNKQTAAAAAQRARFARVRLLIEEIDRITEDGELRSSSVANKASFLTVAAGVVVAASAAQLWTAFPVGGVIALGLACLGLLCAAVALRPARRFGLVAQRLADRYLDSIKTALDIKASLVRQKADVITGRAVVSHLRRPARLPLDMACSSLRRNHDETNSPNYRSGLLQVWLTRSFRPRVRPVG
ncbi:hypothetical protein [Curtobacterium sp. RRHDQ10]|uniref:hypothetical protein n=1 Tax=Curtobacterium phyllosphaerae TaxID=3413379 RepID=UPI003BF235EE